MQKQLKRIRYMLVISITSTVMVAFPNAVSLSAAWLKKVGVGLQGATITASTIQPDSVRYLSE